MKKKVAWSIVLGVVLVIAAMVLYVRLSQRTMKYKLGEDGMVLVNSSVAYLKVDRVYIGDDGNAYIDYTVKTKEYDSSSYVDFSNIEINGWVMQYGDRASAINDETQSGTYLAAHKAVLDYSGITSIDNIRFSYELASRSLSTGKSCLLVLNDSAVQNPAKRTPVAGEKILADEDDLSLIIEQPSVDGVYDGDSHSILVYISNSSSHAMSVRFSLSSINNVGYQDTKEVLLTAGSQARLPIQFSTAHIADYGITSVDKLGFYVDVKDEETQEHIHISNHELFVTGLTEDTLPEYTRLSEEGEQVIVDNEYMTFVIYSVERSDTNMYGVKCYIENKTDYSLSLSTEQPVINGREVRANTSTYGIYPRYKCYENMLFWADDADADEMVEKFSFKLPAYLTIPQSDGENDSRYVTNQSEVYEYCG